jgi:3-hydroxyisobutyrate dehydrogenase
MDESRSGPFPFRRVAFVGVGVMGRSMARHLLAAGADVTVFTRTPDRARPLLNEGATWAASPKAAADGADAAVSMVGYPDDVEAVHLGPEGTLAGERVPPIVIDMTTSRPSLAVRIEHAARERGAMALDAPVSGGDVGAQNATLSIMVGGSPEAFQRGFPLLQRLGKTIVHQGGAGAGQHTKMVNQILIAGTMVGVCEGLLYARKAGLRPELVVESVGGGAAGSWTVQNLVPRILRGDFRPGFFIEHLIKDLGIAADEAERMGLDLPGLRLARSLYERAAAAGLGRRGTQALYLDLARRAGLEVAVEAEPVHGAAPATGSR